MNRLALTLLSIAALSLTGCNKQVLDLNYKYKKVHNFDTHRCYEINSWRDYEDGDQIQVEIKGYDKVLFYANQIALIEDRCPFCEEVEYDSK